MFNTKNLPTYLLLLSMSACTVTNASAPSSVSLSEPGGLRIVVGFGNAKSDEKAKIEKKLGEKFKDKNMYFGGGCVFISEYVFKDAKKKVGLEVKVLQALTVDEFRKVMDQAFYDDGIKVTCGKVYTTANGNIEAKGEEVIFSVVQFQPLAEQQSSGVANEVKMELSTYMLTTTQSGMIGLGFVAVVGAGAWYKMKAGEVPAPAKKTKKS